MESRPFLFFIILLIGIGFAVAQISSANYNIDAAVVSSGGTETESSGFFSKLALGILSGISNSLNFNSYLGLFYGSDTTAPQITIIYPVDDAFYYSFVGDVNYSVDVTANYCWFSKEGSSTNSSVVVAGVNWTNVYSDTVIGLNNWTIFCNDSAGNVGSAVTSFEIDSEIPNVVFSGSTPDDDAVIENSYFIINATSSDESGEHSTFLDFNDSLVGWWKLEETEDGVTFVDSSGDGNDGICSGSTCPNVTGGKRGLAYEFDGVDDYVSFSQINVGDRYTLSAWVYPDAATDSDWFNILSNKGSPQWGCPDSSLQFQLYGRVTGSALTRYSWSYVSLVRNGDSHKLYVNGVFDSEASVSAGYDSYRVIGAYVYDSLDITSREPWHGSIDDIMIFSRALSDSEIESIYDAQTDQYGNVFSDVSNGFYNYTVYAQDLAGNVNSSLRSLEVNMLPTGLNVSVVNNKTLNSELGSLNLTWDDNSGGEDGFSVERSGDNSSFVEVDTVGSNVVDYFDDDLDDNLLFFYKIRSFVGGSYSGYSNIAYNITADRTAPLNPFFELLENSSANGINVKNDETDEGLILYMSFEEGTGSTTSDWSGEENTGTIVGASWVNGDDGNGGALSFDGSEDYINLTGDSMFNTVGRNFTYSFWIEGSGYSSKQSLLSRRYGCNNNGQFNMYVENNRLYFGYYTAPTFVTHSSDAILTNEEIYYVTWVKPFGSTGVKLYVNGIEQTVSGDSSTDGSGSGNPIIIGAQWSKNTCESLPIQTSEIYDYFTGKIDEVRIYNRSLTQEEIIDDMQSGLIKHKIYRSETESGTYLDVGVPIVNGDAELGDSTNFGFDGLTSDSYEGDYAFYETGGKTVTGSQYIPIDMNSEYVLSGMLKSNGSGGLSRLYYGFVPYDKNKQQITNEQVNVRSNTQTTLYEDIVSTDKIVKIPDCLSWYVLSHARMVFNIDDSGNYADLPNRDMSNQGIIRVQNMGDYCEIEFSTTVGKTYPAGTKVRMHISGSSFMYSAASSSYIPTTWTKRSTSVMSGEYLSGASYSGAFWHGTRYVRLLFLINYQQDSTYQLLFDNLKLEVNGGNVSSSNYLDLSGSDRTSPTSISNLNSSDIVEGGFSTSSVINFSWDAATDSGDDYFYHAGTEDSEGNERSIIRDGSFERNVLSSPYFSATRGDISIDDSVSRNGNQSLKHVATSTDSYTSPYVGSSAPLINLSGDSAATFKYSIYAKSDSSRNIQLYIFCLDSNFDYSAYGLVSNSQTIETAWEKSEVSKTCPVGTRYVSVRVDNDGGAGGTIWWDDAKLYRIYNESVTTDVAGYSVLCDDWQASIPNDLINTTDLNYSCPTTEGTNYFHVKALDGADNYGSVVRFGPFYVDTAAPQIQFVFPTPDNATVTTNTSMEAKISISDYSLGYLNFSWNGTNLSSLEDGLVLAMNFQNLSSLEENDSFVSDVSGNGNDGAVVGASYTDSGKFGKAMSFDGNDNYVDLERNIMGTTSTFTVSHWIKLNEDQMGKTIFSNGNSRWVTGVADSSAGLGSNYIKFYLTTGTIYSTYSLDIGKWYHVTCSYDNGVGKIYIDGQLDNTETYTATLTADKNNMIGRLSDGGQYFSGQIDEVRVYNRSLSADEIDLLYKSNLQKSSTSGWSLSMNMTNLSRGDYYYSASACDLADNCNATEERVWTRINTAPVADSVVLNSSSGDDRAYDNLSVTIESHDFDAEDTVFNITDWRVENESLAVLNMPFEGGSNSTWTRDYSKNENNGTVFCAIWNISGGKVGGAYEFDGDDDYISVPFQDFDEDSIFSGGAWIKLNKYSTDANVGAAIFEKYSSNQGFFFAVSNLGKLRFRGHTGTSSLEYVTTETLELNTWYYVNFVMNGDSLKLYINSEKVKDVTFPTSYVDNPSEDFNIGSWSGNYFYFNGSIDEVLIFNRSLSAEQINEIYNAGVANHSVEKIVSQETVDGERWSVMVTPNDLIEDGLSMESNTIYLFNNLPTVTLNSPEDSSDVINRTPEFNWTGYDADGDDLTYELELHEHLSAGDGLCSDDRNRTNLNDDSWTPTVDLKCLGDYGYYYTWRVRAHDGEAFGAWTDEFNFTMNSYVIVSLVNSDVEFGNIAQLSSDDTSDDDPLPFVIQNDGNVQINISANATQMWATQPNASEYYKTKVDNRSGKEGAFTWLSSIVDWMNMSITGRVTLIDKLKYGDSEDSAEIDIYLEVPPNEGPGLKSSSVVFEASFAEEDVV